MKVRLLFDCDDSLNGLNLDLIMEPNVRYSIMNPALLTDPARSWKKGILSCRKTDLPISSNRFAAN